MTPSKKAAGPSAAEQMRLPSAPIHDRYGLHAEECECQRCQVGYRPTSAERHSARCNFERLAAAKKAAEQNAKKEVREDVKRRTTWERLAQSERDTAEKLKAMNKPVERPATAEELAELKALHGFKRRNAP